MGITWLLREVTVANKELDVVSGLGLQMRQEFCNVFQFGVEHRRKHFRGLHLAGETVVGLVGRYLGDLPKAMS